MREQLQLFFLVFVALAFAVIIAAMLAPEQREEQPVQGECKEGENRSCMKGPCEGTETCSNGTWGRCTVERICTPGARTPCVENYCASAYKICNDCGTGYGPCLKNSS